MIRMNAWQVVEAWIVEEQVAIVRQPVYNTQYSQQYLVIFSILSNT